VGYDKHEKAIAQAARMPGTRFHDVRHFRASQLMANGETAAYVRDRMGIRASKSPAMEKARGKSEVDVSKTLAIEAGGKPKPDASN
jgi:hypothetical protein